MVSNNNFIHLHNHSEDSNFRLLDSINKPEDMVRYVAGLGQHGMAITDHESLSAHYRFLKAVETLKLKGEIPEDFKPILGNEIYLLNEQKLTIGIENNESLKFYHFLLLAKDEIGHYQLRKLSTRAWDRMFNYKGMDRVPTYYTDFEDIVVANRGHLIASTSCLGSFFAQKVLELLDENNSNKDGVKLEIHEFVEWAIAIFGKEDFYIEIQPSLDEDQIEYNKMAIHIAKAYNLGFIVTTDAHYLKLEDAPVHEAYLTSSESENNREVASFYSSTYFMSVEDIKNRMCYLSKEDFESAILNTKKIADKIEIYGFDKPQQIPEIAIPEESTWWHDDELYSFVDKWEWLWIKNIIHSEDIRERYLANRCLKGFKEKYEGRNEKDIQEALDRINLEFMEIIGSSIANNVTLSSYFTMLEKLIDLLWEEANAIVMPGRGSAGGFLINELLDIVQVNPLDEEVEMPHWRFISADKPSFPDIDIDYPSHKRDIVFQTIQKYYNSIGGDVVRVATFGTETSKSAVRTTCRGLKLNSDIGDFLSSLIPIERGKVRGIASCYYGEEERPPIKEFVNKVNEIQISLNEQAIIDDEEPKDFLKIALGIEGLRNKRSSHACGLIPLNYEYEKLCSKMRTPSGEFITQYSLDEMEAISGMKMDFLNTKTASMVQTCMELLVENGRMEWQGSLKKTYWKYLHPKVLNQTEPEMWEMLNDGKLLSAFQFDSPVGERAIAVIQPKNKMEAVNANNLMRLMVEEEGAEQPLDLYVRYKNNIDEWYQDMQNFGLTAKAINILEKHLLKDYGVCSTQEGMMMLAMDKDVSNFNVIESDILRKGVSKKLGEKYEKAHELFYKNGLKLGTEPKLLDYIWNKQIGLQRGYGFSLLHGIEYTYILIQQLNLAHFYPPIYWNTSVLLVESVGLDIDEEEANKATKAIDYGVVASAICNVQSKGIEVRLPDINLSSFGFTPNEKDNLIMYGLKGIIGLNNEAVHDIINGRPYKSLEDFHKKMTLTKREVVDSSGKTKRKSLVPTGKVVTLIKSGAFDIIENKSREQILKDYLLMINPPKTKLIMSNFENIINMGIVPDELSLQVRILRYKKFITDKKYIVEDDPSAKSKFWYSLKRENESISIMTETFFEDNFISHLTENLDYRYEEDGSISILTGADSCNFDKLIKEKTIELKQWMDSPDCLDRYNNIIFEDDWNKNTGSSNSISKWEMDSVGFYYHDHELKNVDRELYSIVNYFDLSDEPEVIGYNEWKEVKYPKYEIVRICGTVVSRDKTKHVVTLLTPEGAVPVKYQSGQFANYDKQISYLGSDGKKVTLEDGWFKRGNKLLICGYRINGKFKPKKYRDTIWKNTTMLIEDIDDETGKLTIKSERSRVE